MKQNLTQLLNSLNIQDKILALTIDVDLCIEIIIESAGRTFNNNIYIYRMYSQTDCNDLYIILVKNRKFVIGHSFIAILRSDFILEENHKKYIIYDDRSA